MPQNCSLTVRPAAASSPPETLSLDFDFFKEPFFLGDNPVLFLLASAYEKLTCTTELLGPLRGWMLAVVTKP